MKDNILKLKDKNGKTKEFRIILDIENNSTKLNYVIYTEDKRDDNGSIIAYAASYILSPKGNMTKLKPLETEEEFDFINEILSSLQTNN